MKRVMYISLSLAGLIVISVIALIIHYRNDGFSNLLETVNSPKKFNELATSALPIIHEARAYFLKQRHWPTHMELRNLVRDPRRHIYPASELGGGIIAEQYSYIPDAWNYSSYDDSNGFWLSHVCGPGQALVYHYHDAKSDWLLRDVDLGVDTLLSLDLKGQ